METYITRQPIMNQDRKVVAYELIYQQDSSVLHNQRDSHVASAIAEYFNDLGASNFMEGKDAFMTFTPNLLRQEIPHIFGKDKLVLQIEENALVHPETKAIVEEYKKKGYKLAMIGFEFNSRYMDILPKLNYMKLNFKAKSESELRNYISLCQKFSIKTIAYNVDTAAARDKALAIGVDYFQGASIAEMVRTKTHRMDHLQSNFFRLMAAITAEEPDLDEISRLISIDVTLAFSLMRLVNSAYFGLRQKVNDIRQALVILGLGPLKQWIYLLSFNTDGGMHDEVIKTSFQRAVLCQKLTHTTDTLRTLSDSDAYILGMFSTLDILLEVSMEEALEQLPLSEELNEALTKHTGIYGELLELCIDYEKGQWGSMAQRAEVLGIPVNIISQKYIEAVENVNETWSELRQSGSETEN